MRDLTTVYDATMSSAEQVFELRAGDSLITYTLGYSSRAKRVQLRVGSAGVQVRLPAGVAAEVGHQFVSANAGWVLDQLRRAARQQTEPSHPLLPEPLQETLEHDGKAIVYTIKPSARARRARVVVGTGGVELVVPARADLAAARAFLRNQADWVLRHIAKRDAIADAQTPLSVNTILWRGTTTPVRLRLAERTVDIRHIGDVILIDARSSTAAQAALTRWIQRQAVKVISEAVNAFAAHMGVRPGRITLRDQQSRWGSCSARRTVSFNWRLIHAPPGVLDYVVIHELAHLIEFNHSKRFWALVETHCPDYRAHAAWLKRDGWQLRQTPKLTPLESHA
jgi:predicted metal-dependent hydrolase